MIRVTGIITEITPVKIGIDVFDFDHTIHDADNGLNASVIADKPIGDIGTPVDIKVIQSKYTGRLMAC